MHRILGRTLIALSLSLAGFLGTMYWYESGTPKASRNSDAPIARITSAIKEVQRKPQRRVIWEGVLENDELYPGDSVRTTKNAAARFELIKSGAQVRVEPESLIVLEENDKGLTLDFLEGNLFVQMNGGDTGVDALKVRAGSGEVQMTSADLSLSKNGTGLVNLEVHRGQADLVQSGKTTALKKSNLVVLTEKGAQVSTERMDLIKPSAGENILLNVTRGDKFDVEWKPLPAGYQIKAEVGPTHAQMSTLPIRGEGSIGRMRLALKPGAWVIKLTATPSEGSRLAQLTSTTVPFVIESKIAPNLIEPRGGSTVLMQTSPEHITAFHWVNRHLPTNQILEVASDDKFKTLVSKQNLSSDADTASAPLKEGKYFWRVTSYLASKSTGSTKPEALTSETKMFLLTAKAQTKPPKLLEPGPELHISLSDAKHRGVKMTWEKVEGVEQYQAGLERRDGEKWIPILKRELESMNELMSPGLESGVYRWQVGSLDPKGEVKLSEFRGFTVDALPRLEWTGVRSPDVIEYHSAKPVIGVSWKAFVAGVGPVSNPRRADSVVSYYRVHISAAKVNANSAKSEVKPDETITSKQNSLTKELGDDGDYEMQVEAYNSADELIAQSAVRTITVRPRPLLPAPEWTGSTPDKIDSDGKGNVSFEWKEVTGAKAYVMSLISVDGEVVSSQKVTRPTASATNMKPGQYKVQVKTIDAYQRAGLSGAARTVDVRNNGDIPVPKIKGMKVK